jgi:hypothetical protein
MRSTKTLMSVCMLSLILAAWLACLKSRSSTQQSNSNSPVVDRQSNDNIGSEKTDSKHNEKEDLISLVNTATFDEGELGKQAREKLQQRDRAQLIRTLSNLRDSLPEDDVRRLEIASFFCSIGYEYRANRQEIVSAFDKNSPYRHLHDDVWMMIDRLISGGDKSLLSLGFNAVNRADGALAEAMDDTFDDQLAHDPKSFLSELSKQPKRVRRDVDDYIAASTDQFGYTDVDKLKRYLESVPGRSSLSQTAKEFAAALSAKSKAQQQEKKSGDSL